MEDMQKKKNSFLFLLIVVFSYLLLSNIIFGFTYESNDDPSFENLMRGIYWNTPICNFYFYYRGIAVLFVWLYRFFDVGINWYGWSLIAEGAIACFVISYLLLRKTKSYWTVVLFMMLYLQSLILVSFTRTSIFLSFAALFLFYSADQFRKKRVIYLLGSILFLWAYLMRPNAGMLALLFLMPFIYEKFNITREFFKTLLALSIPFIIAFSFNFFISSFQDKEYTQNIQSIAKHTFPIIDYDVDVSTYTPEQKKIVYELKNWFFFDSKLVNVSTYEHFPNIISSNIPKVDHIIKRLSDLFSMIFHKPLFTLFGLFLVIPLFSKKNFSFKYLLLVGYFLAILVAIAIFLKLEYRIIIPFLTIFYIFVLYTQWEVYLSFIYRKKALPFFFFVITITFFLFQAKLYYKKSKNTLPQSLLNSISVNTPVQAVILLRDPTINYKPTQYIFYQPKLMLVPARGWTAYTEQNYRFQQQIFGTKDIAEIFNKIDKKNDILFISDSLTNRIVVRILKDQKINAKFVELPRNNISSIHFYVFENVTAESKKNSF